MISRNNNLKKNNYYILGIIKSKIVIAIVIYYISVYLLKYLRRT